MMGRPKLVRSDDEKERIIAKLRREIANLKRNPVSSFIERKPDYHYSLSGFYIVRKWCFFNGLTYHQLEIMVIFSFYQYFVIRDMTLWNLNFKVYQNALRDLVALGYIIKVDIPGQRHKIRKGWALTQKGKDVEKDYEKFYDEKMSDFKNRTAGDKPNSKMRFQDGQYFRRERKLKKERREAQGGGELPKSIKFLDRYKDSYPDAKPNDEQA
jgi:predicted transcriptional regulator